MLVTGRAGRGPTFPGELDFTVSTLSCSITESAIIRTSLHGLPSLPSTAQPVHEVLVEREHEVLRGSNFANAASPLAVVASFRYDVTNSSTLDRHCFTYSGG
jgi:hypothetical protein